MAQTRGKTVHFTLGQPSELPKNKLPLEIDVFNKFQKIKEENVNRPTKHIAQELSENIVTLWKEKGNLPTVDIRWVQELVEDIYSRGRELLKIPKVRREKILAEMDTEDNCDKKGKRGRKGRKFESFDKLFDICPCKHDCRDDCNCPADLKVSAREFLFLVDQRTDRKMEIGEITNDWEESRERKEKKELFDQKEDIRQEKVREDKIKYRK